MFAHVQPAQGRTAGRGRPALVTGVFLLVSSLALLVPPPASPDAPSSFSTSRLVDVLEVLEVVELATGNRLALKRPHSVVSVRGERSTIEEIQLSHLLCVVDHAERLAH